MVALAALMAQHAVHGRCLPEPAGALLQELRGSADALVSRVPPYGYAQPQPALQPGSSGSTDFPYEWGIRF